MSPWIANVRAAGLPARRCRPSTFWVTSANRSPSARVVSRTSASWPALGAAAPAHAAAIQVPGPHVPRHRRERLRASRAPAGGTRARRPSSSPPGRETSGSRSRRRPRRRSARSRSAGRARAERQAATTLSIGYYVSHAAARSWRSRLSRSVAGARRRPTRHLRKNGRPQPPFKEMAPPDGSLDRGRRRRCGAPGDHGEHARRSKPDFEDIERKAWLIARRSCPRLRRPGR